MSTFRFFHKGVPADIFPTDFAYTVQAHVDEVEWIFWPMMQQTNHYTLQQKSKI